MEIISLTAFKNPDVNRIKTIFAVVPDHSVVFSSKNIPQYLINGAGVIRFTKFLIYQFIGKYVYAGSFSYPDQRI